MTIYRNPHTKVAISENELDDWYDGLMDPELNPKQPHRSFDRWLTEMIYEGHIEEVK